jgi:Flp pilus assembly pilin Flp
MFNALLIKVGIALKSGRLSDERGVLAIEHGLIVGLIAVVIIGAAGSLAGTVFEWFSGTGGGAFVP